MNNFNLIILTNPKNDYFIISELEDLGISWQNYKDYIGFKFRTFHQKGKKILGIVKKYIINPEFKEYDVLSDSIIPLSLNGDVVSCNNVIACSKRIVHKYFKGDIPNQC